MVGGERDGAKLYGTFSQFVKDSTDVGGCEHNSRDLVALGLCLSRTDPL
jgi:hypothetical protein